MVHNYMQSLSTGKIGELFCRHKVLANGKQMTDRDKSPAYLSTCSMSIQGYPVFLVVTREHA